MKVIIRLYKQHDLDLIALHKNTNFKLTKAMKTSLSACVNNEDIKIKTPIYEPINIDNISKIVTLFIILDDDKDIDIISWISNIKKGYRNSAIKNLVRGYLSKPVIEVYNDQKSNKEGKKINLISTKAQNAKNKNSNNALLDDVIDGYVQKDTMYIENIEDDKEITLQEVLERKNETLKNEREDEELFDAFNDIMNSF